MRLLNFFNREVEMDMDDIEKNHEKVYEEKYEMVKKLRGIELDNAIYGIKQQRNLTNRQRKLIIEADIAYLQDKEEISAYILSEVYRDIDKNISQVIHAALGMGTMQNVDDSDLSMSIIRDLDELHKEKNLFKRRLKNTMEVIENKYNK